MEKREHLLVVDDDPEIRALLRDYLDQNSFRTTTAADGKAMWQALDQAPVDLVILDVMMPGDDGLVLCRNLRARSNIPIIMLTARGEDMDRIIGLEMGADDYLPKPFNPRELLARIKVILRRARQTPANGFPESARAVRFANWTLDLAARHLKSAEGVVVSLSSGEFRLLQVFLEHPNRVLTRDQLLDFCQGRDWDPYDRSIDVQVSRLRRRLGDDAKDPTIIKTVRGEGYLLTAQVTVEH